MKNHKLGFTLVEILIVIGLIAILASLALVALNPFKNAADARNSVRVSDTIQIADAISQYLIDGNTIASLGTIPLCTATPASIGTGGVNLSTTLVSTYIAAIPKDPSGGTDSDTGYTICNVSSTSNRLRIAAPDAENGKTISVTR